MTDDKLKSPFAAAQAIEDAIRDLDEDDKKFVLRMVCEYHNVQTETPTVVLSQPDVSEISSISEEYEPSDSQHPSLDEYLSAFTEESAPGFATHLAFYWAFKAENTKDVITPSDFADACRAAGRKVPGNSRQPLFQAKERGYLEDAGHGIYRLTVGGENYARGNLRESRKSPKKTTAKTKKTTKKK